MRAVYYETTGPAAEVLALGTVPDPKVGPGDVCVRIDASGINPADVKRRAGWGGLTMQHARVIPHCDGAGVIEAVGGGVSADRIGQRVWLWNAQGGYGQAGRAHGTAAELVALPAGQAVPLAEYYSMAQGACLGVPAMTAYRCVMADGPVTGQTVLIQGGLGAVGYLALQIAFHEGARIIATASRSGDFDRLRAFGAVPIDRHNEDVVSRALDLTNGEGVDRVIEVDFAANQGPDVLVLKRNGTIASYSCTSNPKPTLDYYALAAKGGNVRFVQGFELPEAARTAGQQWLAKHRLDVPIATEFALEDCAKAHLQVERAGVFGQTVVIP